MTAIHLTQPLFGNAPIGTVVPSPTNPRKRFNEEDLHELTASVREHGVLQPILVRPVKGDEPDTELLEVVAGERRYRAAQMAGLAEIPVLVRDLTDVQALEIQIIENLQRKDVHEIEEAEGYHQLMEKHGYTADALAEKVGKSRSYIFGRLKLRALVPAARDAFYDGKLNSSLALLIARIPVPELQEHATEEITTRNNGETMSYRSAVEHIQERYMLDLDRARFDIKDAKLVKAAGACTACDKRTGSHPLLFPDVGADVCTDPNCFASKSRANDQKTIDAARKKGIPVLEGEEAVDEFESDAFSTLDDNLHAYQRVVTRTKLHQSLEDLIPAELMPEPVKYAVIDGKPQPLFEPTAMQTALEKAGMCETEEQQKERLAEERAAGQGKKPAVLNSANDQQKKQKELNARAEKESEFRAAVFMRARENFILDQQSTGLLQVEILREIACLLLDDYAVADCIPAGTYPKGDKETRAFLSAATRQQVELFLLDTMMSSVVRVSGWECNGQDPAKNDDHKVLMRIADLADVDADQIRTEIFPPAKEKEAKPKTGKAKAPAKKASTKSGAKKATDAASKRMAQVTPSEQLAKIVGAEPLNRVEATKRIWEYIKKNKLQDTVNRRMINPDDALAAVFGGASQVSMFEMTKLVATHLEPQPQQEISTKKVIDPAAAWPFPTRDLP